MTYFTVVKCRNTFSAFERCKFCTFRTSTIHVECTVLWPSALGQLHFGSRSKESSKMEGGTLEHLFPNTMYARAGASADSSKEEILNCHGAISGRALDTSASNVSLRNSSQPPALHPVASAGYVPICCFL